MQRLEVDPVTHYLSQFCTLSVSSLQANPQLTKEVISARKSWYTTLKHFEFLSLQLNIHDEEGNVSFEHHCNVFN